MTIICPNLLKHRNKPPNMKILHVIPYIHPRYGGPSKAIIEMCKSQKDMGIDVEIATTHFHNEEPVLISSLKINFFPSYLGELKYSPELKKWLEKNIKKYDLVHIHTIFAYSTVIGTKLSRKYKIPHIIRTTGQLYEWCLNNKSKFRKKLWWHLFDKGSIKSADSIHYTTIEESRKIAYKIKPKSKYVLPIGLIKQKNKIVDIPLIKNKKYFIFLSRLNPIKGLDLLLPSIKEVLLKNNYHLIIAGSGEEEYIQKLKKKISHLNLNNHVIFVGHVSGDTKYTLLKKARAFILPSHSENFGIAIIEAMAVGTPVLTSNKVGIYDDIINAKAGMVFSLKKDQIKFCCDKIINNDRFANSISENAKKLVEEKYNWSKITTKQIQIYQKIIYTHESKI